MRLCVTTMRGDGRPVMFSGGCPIVVDGDNVLIYDFFS